MATGWWGALTPGTASHRCGSCSDHVGEMRKLYVAFVASGRIHEFHDPPRTFHPRSHAPGGAAAERQADSPQRAALAHAFGGALVSLLAWWIDGGCVMTPARWTTIPHHGVVGGGQVAGPR